MNQQCLQRREEAPEGHEQIAALVREADGLYRVVADHELIVADSRAEAQQVDSLWTDVQQVGDDLATKKFQRSFAAQYANPTMRTAIALQRMQQFYAAIVAEQYVGPPQNCAVNQTYSSCDQCGVLYLRVDCDVNAGGAGETFSVSVDTSGHVLPGCRSAPQFCADESSCAQVSAAAYGLVCSWLLSGTRTGG